MFVNPNVQKRAFKGLFSKFELLARSYLLKQPGMQEKPSIKRIRIRKITNEPLPQPVPQSVPHPKPIIEIPLSSICYHSMVIA